MGELADVTGISVETCTVQLGQHRTDAPSLGSIRMRLVIRLCITSLQEIEFAHQVDNTIYWGLVPFTTKNRYLSIANATQTRAFVTAIAGCSIAVVLRKAGSQFELVRACFVLRRIYGEAIEKVRRDGAISRQETLRTVSLVIAETKSAQLYKSRLARN